MQESLLFNHPVGPRDRVFRFSSKHLYLLSHLTGPWAGEKTQSEKCLLLDYADLSLDPNTQVKAGFSIIPGPEEQPGEWFLVCLFYILLFCVVKVVCMCVTGYLCRDQRSTYENQFFSSTMCAPAIKLRSLHLEASVTSVLNHLNNPPAL